MTDSWPGAYVDRPFGPPGDPPKDIITIELPGTPSGKGRPRFSRKTGHTYTPEKTRSYEGALRHMACLAMGGAPPIDGPIAVHVEGHFATPLSWSKKKRAAAEAGDVLHTTKPDADNLLKMLDALNKVVFRDDKQVVMAVISKHYSVRPRLLIKITRV